jgi:hypothetical protein
MRTFDKQNSIPGVTNPYEGFENRQCTRLRRGHELDAFASFIIHMW